MKPHNVKRFKKPIKFVCKSCGKDFRTPSIKTIADMTKHDGASLNCYHCGFLYMVKDKKLVDFHKELNRSDPKWPVDGKGTASFDI